jgi:hypothetical protein
MSSSNQHQPVLRRLDRFELREASMWVAEKWFEQFVRSADGAEGSTELAEFGAFEPNLAEAIVLDHGSDFVFPKWGAALNTLCGGDHRGHRLSVLPQPSRGQLRRLCVRATVAQAPAADGATWIVDGQIWQCAMLAMPTAGDELAATRLLVAVLFVPHPIFAAQVVPDDASHTARLDWRLSSRERLADPAEREPMSRFTAGSLPVPTMRTNAWNWVMRSSMPAPVPTDRWRASPIFSGKSFPSRRAKLQDAKRSEPNTRQL